MDRIVVGILLSGIVFLLVPWPWAKQHLVLMGVTASGMFVLSPLVYKYKIVEENIRHFRALWVLKRDRNGYFGWVTLLSWCVPVLSRAADLHGTSRPFGGWMLMTLCGVLAFAFVVSLYFLVLIIVPDNSDDIAASTEVNEMDAFWKGAGIFRLSFPMAFFTVASFVVKNARPASRKIGDAFHAFAMHRGLAADATKTQDAYWWGKKLFALVVWVLGVIGKIVFWTIAGPLLLASYVTAQALRLVLKPIDDRMVVVLADLAGFLLYAKLQNADMRVCFVGGGLVAMLHVTLGFWIAGKIPKLIKKIVSSEEP